MLRDMSLLSHRGIPTWPPTWSWTGKGQEKPARGEVGVLREVRTSVVASSQPGSISPDNRIYLFMDYRDSGYVGCLLMDDTAACRQIGRVLAELRGWSIKQIGDIDLEHLL
ncbi:MAG TPA: hypothetical protein VKH64_13505 [Candidatus Binatia bacterium]|nr:hypothetical protein [Candidatus Binatia bacterium]